MKGSARARGRVRREWWEMTGAKQAQARLGKDRQSPLQNAWLRPSQQGTHSVATDGACPSVCALPLHGPPGLGPESSLSIMTFSA